MKPIKAHFLDTSALVKLVVDEDCSEKVRSYFNSETVFKTTSLCFAEALGVLKAMRFRRKKISEPKYLSASEQLVGYIRTGKISVEEVDITQRDIYDEVERISEKYQIDLVDAFQIVTLKKGFLSICGDDSKSMLITSDSELAKAAKKENLCVWNCIKENCP